MLKRFFGQISLFLIVMIALAGSVSIGIIFSLVDIITPSSYTAQVSDFQDVRAQSYLVFDMESGEILFSRNIDTVLPIASITKLHTAATFYEYNNVWATTSIAWSDIAEYGRAGKLTFGQIYTFHTLLFPLLLESSNDASAVYLRADRTLIDLMNEKAEALGLQHTVFADTSGLSANNVSTASDLRTLFTYIYKSYPHIIDITRLRSYLNSINGWMNNNQFVSDPAYRGGKHGFTPEADHTVVSAFLEPTSSTERRIIGYILLGTDDLAHDMRILRSWTQSGAWFW